MVGGKTLLGFFLNLEKFRTLGDIWVMAVEKNGQDIQASRDFQPMLKTKKKNLPPMYSHGGASYPYPGNPTKGQEDGFKPTKTLPRGLKRCY